jgi:hypothetical protein
MMRRATILIAALVVVLFAGAFSKPAMADVSFSFFYSNLSPYGTWAVSADYGRVWRPHEYVAGWNPYYDGHWVYTDYGWTWVSDYAWGSVPYHYGTWTLDPAMGWVWVPGYVWAPSWVVFSTGPDYIGWAPVPPRFVVGATIGFNAFAPERCVFVPSRSFLAPHVRAYAVPRTEVNVVISRTRIVNNISVQNHVVVNRGPDRGAIEKAAGYSIRPMPIARVKNVTPSGRFDPAEVRADRHSGGGGPLRATVPEPVSRHAEPLRHAEVPVHQTQPAHRSAPAHQAQPMHKSPPAHQQPHAAYTPAPVHQQPHAQPHQAYTPAHQPPSGGAPGGAHGQQAGHPAQQQHGRPPQKPEQHGKPGGETAHGGRG